jgi:hypothetical protein
MSIWKEGEVVVVVGGVGFVGELGPLPPQARKSPVNSNKSSGAFV